jgi:hypothetical protein
VNFQLLLNSQSIICCCVAIGGFFLRLQMGSFQQLALYSYVSKKPILFLYSAQKQESRLRVVITQRVSKRAKFLWVSMPIVSD